MGLMFNTAAYADKATLVAGDLLPIGDSAALTGGVPDDKTATLTNLAAFVAANAVTLAGVVAKLQTTVAAASASTTAGVGLTITADPAVAGTTNAGAAAGGSVTITAGAAARLTSGNADGGFITLIPGTGVGTSTSLVVPNFGVKIKLAGGAGTDITDDLILLSKANSNITLYGTNGVLRVAGSNELRQGAAVDALAYRNFDDLGVATFSLGSSTLQLASANLIAWSNNTTYYGAKDVSVYRPAAGVVSIGSGGASGAGWIQNSAGEAALNAAFTDATGTLAATNLSVTVIAGRSYRITGCLQVSNSTATEGVQIAFDGGACSATTFFMSASMVGTNVAGAQVSTTLGGVINYTTVTGTDYIILNGYLKANAGGTLILRAAENTTATGTMTLGIGSWIALSDTVRL